MNRRKSKGKRGVPVDWDELKKQRSLILTDTAWALLQELGKGEGVSRSEWIERAVRGLVKVDAVGSLDHDGDNPAIRCGLSP